MLYLNQKDFLLDYLRMFPGHCHSNLIKSHRPHPEEAKPPHIKLLSNNIIRVPPTFDFDCSIFSNEYLTWVKEKMSHFKLCFLGVLNPLGNLHIAWWGGAIQSISSSYLLDFLKKKVNSSNSGQKIVACQAAELPGFHVTLETSTGAPASE